MRGIKLDYNSLIGTTINNFEILGLGRKVGYHQWLVCKCLKCGEIKEFRTYEIVKGKSKSCECFKFKHKDLEGKKFGRLVILHEVEQTNNRRTFKVRCDCGKEFNCMLQSLVNGHTQSCGCLNREIISKPKVCDKKLRNMRFHVIYEGMLGRTRGYGKKSRKYYYDKGIKCEWNNFKEFLDDMLESYEEHVKKYGEKNTTLDRIDNSKNYCKENCRWATCKEQYLNRDVMKFKNKQ